ncbi:MAG: 4'-phosphopantetheinyl transferase superfamily protein [Alysiella sp.]|uniref:4'-phosphopantetheinyl transferase family protein n=1 Tax=Alysiella sp. TaxID=1872483 RepID=UPI0026DB01E8|nr:4'-phosphopantetheinyl transferase superfamily protein [Alysiella sp.]MDO4434360.1 4'-phosphopantetheinyl transferase superfamily protein [Alysiella sp.]
MKILNCLLADNSTSMDYRHECLDANDSIRLAQSPKLAQNMDWRVSRFLKQKSPEPILSLSHSRGRAAILSSNTKMVCGVDIETVKQRDFVSLSQWICSPSERDFLAHHAWQAVAFYRLWCIKEALIKAANLSFPADMPQVGYCFHQDKHMGLHIQGQTNWAGVSGLWGEDAVLACVWQGNNVSWQVKIWGETSNLHELYFFQAA